MALPLDDVRMGTPPVRKRNASTRLAMLAMLTAFGSSGAEAVRGAALIRQEDAARNGLVRAWFSQVPVDPARSRITAWHLYNDRVYSVSNAGLVTALNAETGEELWTRQVGRSDFPAFGPTANDRYLGVVRGSTLYLLERETGRVIWTRQLGSAPSSGPALSDDYAYVALVTGRIEGYRLDDPAAQPWYYQSKGRTHLRPTTTGKIVSWPTTEGIVYVSRANDPGVLFRLETNEDIVTSPAEQDPYLYLASLDGYLYCVEENTGRQQWRYSTGYPISSSPAVVGNFVYVASLEPVLHAIDSKTGASKWTAPGVSHFAAQGRQRVYASDRSGDLLILDLESGRPMSRIEVGEGQYTLVNDQSDRVYVVSDSGLVQCLREMDAVTPTLYRAKPPAPDAEAAEDAAAAPGEAAEPAPQGRPGEPLVDEVGEPGFEEPREAADAPQRAVDEPPDDDNPFGADF